MAGPGAGAGGALRFAVIGLPAALTDLGDHHLFPVLRDAEDVLPDHDVVVAQA